MSYWLERLLYLPVVIFCVNPRVRLPQVLLNLGAYRSMQSLVSMISGQGPGQGRKHMSPCLGMRRLLPPERRQRDML